MRRFRWVLLIAAILAVAGASLWLLAGPPREYLLRQECARFHETRKAQYTLLRFQRARAGEAAAAELDRRMDQMLRETRSLSVRGWEVVLVPSGALPPVRGHRLALTVTPSAPGDPAAVGGPMGAWIRPTTWVGRLFMPG